MTNTRSLKACGHGRHRVSLTIRADQLALVIRDAEDNVRVTVGPLDSWGEAHRLAEHDAIPADWAAEPIVMRDPTITPIREIIREARGGRRAR